VETVRFQTSDGVLLEGELRVDGEAWGSAVVCHPHPQHGGSKDHPILWAIRNALAQLGLAVLTFNFRGVMGSEGTFGGGVQEPKDVHAAVTRVRESAAGPTFVAGWSFGAHMALRNALTDERVSSVALVGFALAPRGNVSLPDPPSAEELGGLGRPVLFVSGDEDVFCPVEDLRELAAWIPGAEVEIVEGADHFFSRRERDAAALVAAFANRTLRR
jgi:hypothetical protein